MERTWNARNIDALCASFQKARIILSAAELDVFSKFRQGSKSVKELCELYGWNARALEILLDALASMGFLCKQGESYLIEDHMSKLLDSGSEESILPMLLHRVRMWNSWSNLTPIVTGTYDFESFFKAPRSRDDMKAFIGAMEVIGRQKAREIANDVNIQSRRKLLDIGAGSGVYSRVLLEMNPDLTATLFDLPVVIEMTRDRLSKSSIADRIQYAEGDYNTDTLPLGHDVALLSAIIHINGRGKNRSLFAKAFEALNPNGLLIIRDHVMEDSRIAPEDGAIFAVNMLVATREGNTYTFTEVSEDLMAAGFHDIRLVREGSSMDQLITAVK